MTQHIFSPTRFISNDKLRWIILDTFVISWVLTLPLVLADICYPNKNIQLIWSPALPCQMMLLLVLLYSFIRSIWLIWMSLWVTLLDDMSWFVVLSTSLRRASILPMQFTLLLIRLPYLFIMSLLFKLLMSARYWHSSSFRYVFLDVRVLYLFWCKLD